MKFDLHCNLPYNPVVPNASLGYLKGYLSGKKIDTRNIYWNVLLYKIIEKYQLFEKFRCASDIVPITATTTFLSKHLYEKNVNDKKSTLLSTIFKNIIDDKDLSNLIKEIKTFIDRYIEENRLHEVDLAGFTVKSYQWLLSYYIIKKLKEYNPNLKIVLGGLHSPSQAFEYMKQFSEVDFAIWCEGEVPSYELITNVDNPSFYKKIPNLVFRDKSHIVKTFSINQDKVNDRPNFPFANHEDYFDQIKKLDVGNLTPRIPIWGIRTCNWNKCKFCIVDNETAYCERDPENIVEEIEFQAKKHKTNCFYFVDNDFGRKDQESFDKLLELLLKSSNKQKKPYEIMGEISPLRLNRKTIELMKKISIEPVQIGFESTSDNILKKIRKKHRFINNIQALKLAEEQDFMVSGINVIMGIPSETKEDVTSSIDNLRFLRFLVNKYPLTIVKLILYKGSPFYDELSESEKKEWDQSVLWDEISKLSFLASASRYDFFGFNTPPHNDYLWIYFDYLLNYYRSSKFSYKWMLKSDGSSIVDTSEGKYHLDSNETNILTFCDTIKKYEEIKSFFTDLNENNLQGIFSQLHKIGLLYYDKKRENFLSILSNKKKVLAK